MAKKKISAYTAATSYLATDGIPLIAGLGTSPASRVMTTEDLFTEIPVGVVVKGVGQGPAGATEKDALLVAPTAAITTEIGRGVNVVMDWSGATGATGYSLSGTVSGGGNHGHFYGVQSWTYATSSGTTDRLAGLMSTLTQSAGTVSEWVGLLFPAITVSGGTLSKAWHIYTETAKRSYFAGGITVSDALVTTPVNTTSPDTGVLRSHHDSVNTNTGFNKYGVFVISTNSAAAGIGGIIALGGESGAASTPYPFAFIQGAKESSGATYNGFLSIHTTDASSDNSEKMRVTGTGGNVCIGITAAGTDAVKALAIGTGTAPSASPADAAQLYSADQAAGNACLHTRTEHGEVVKLFQGAAVADSTNTTDVITRLNELLARMRANGLIAT
jgi:hypothetical protein